jgi:hypothetical protein
LVSREHSASCEGNMVRVDVRKFRETVTIALIALLVGMAVYSLLGLAWTFKSAVEVSQKIKRSF